MVDVFHHKVSGKTAGMLEVAGGRIPDGLGLTTAMNPGVKHWKEELGDGKYGKLGTCVK